MLELALPLILGLTTLTALSGLLFEDGNTPESKEDGPDDHLSGGAQAEVEYIDIGPDQRGSFVGSELSDTIVVRAETDFRTTHLWDKYEDEMTSYLDVRGGGGNDVLILEGRGYIVDGDEGADTIELREASDVAVYAGTDDTVLGGSGQGNFVRLDENAAFFGGAGNDLVHSSSTAPTHMGDGNDTYIGVRSPTGAGEVASIVYGGNGDDYLVGSISAENLWWEHASDRGYISFDSDTLFGGAGNDTIIGSHSDFITGGPGNDHFFLFLSDDPLAEGATIADFSQGEDRLEIRYEYSGEYDRALSDYGSISYKDFKTISDPSEGFTILSADGKMIAQFLGVDSLVVGFLAWDNDSTVGSPVDLAGNPISLKDCDVVIQGSIISSA